MFSLFQYYITKTSTGMRHEKYIYFVKLYVLHGKIRHTDIQDPVQLIQRRSIEVKIKNSVGK